MQTTIADEKKTTIRTKTSIVGEDRITVNLGKRSYDIMVCQNRLKDFGKLLQVKKPSKEVMVFTSPKIGGLHFGKLENSLRSAGFTRIIRHDIPDGEKNKNFAQFTKCIDALTRSFPESGEIPTVVNLGGGVVGDLGGFAAATFRRGVPYVQVPTTLLGDVDCGVGGKVAINFKKVKNLVGTFYQPVFVFTDLSFLETLDAREVRSGVAEVIKYGAVCSASLFDYLEKNIEKLLILDSATVRHVVNTCYGLKAEIVRQDEEDNQGIRIVLNFGHTVGHALEMEARYKMTHGEAISIGMIAATRIALQFNKCDESVYSRLRSLIKRAGLPVSIPPEFNINLSRLLGTMRHDKKAVGGANRFVLPTEIGKSCTQVSVDESVISEAVKSCFTDSE